MIALVIYLCVLFFSVAMSPLGLFPSVKWNGNASQNDWLRIEMLPARYYIERGFSMIGVYAQERINNWLRWLTAAAFSASVAIPAFIMVENEWVALALSLMALLLGHVITRSDAWWLQSELIGHTAEAVVAGQHGHDFATYMREEAERIYRNPAYDGLFDDYDLDQLIDAMYSRVPIARFLSRLQTMPLDDPRLVR